LSVFRFSQMRSLNVHAGSDDHFVGLACGSAHLDVPEHRTRKSLTGRKPRLKTPRLR
jgi:hypothetical protein